MEDSFLLSALLKTNKSGTDESLMNLAFRSSFGHTHPTEPQNYRTTELQNHRDTNISVLIKSK